MARKIQRLILTDALCWIPTCICAYLYIAGIDLADEVCIYHIYSEYIIDKTVLN